MNSKKRGKYIPRRWSPSDDEWLRESVREKAVNSALTQYPMGYAVVRSHDVPYIHEAFNVCASRYTEIVDDALMVFITLDLVSEGIETLIERYSGSELVIALLTYGQAMADYRNALIVRLR